MLGYVLSDELVLFIKNNIEPIDDSRFGKIYRASVYLNDGTYLPCVAFCNTGQYVNQAMKRIKEELAEQTDIFHESSAVGFYDVVKIFVAGRNTINYYDIKSIEKCRYAFPLYLQEEIRGETTMGWTGFVAKMKDGKLFSFGTNWNFEFFSMPENYSAEDAVEIINHSYVGSNGEVKSYRGLNSDDTSDFNHTNIHKAKVFFYCFIDNYLD